ncbi:MAG: ATP synthase F1 subunit delta [Clostridia bacterium]|nr:ATP synthase F1 subunit delta [Clostridia bacterium]
MSDISKVYAGALYSLSQEEAAADEVLNDLKSIDALLRENESYCSVLDAPQIAFSERESLIKEAFSSLHPYAVNTLCLLAKKRETHSFVSFLRDFTTLYNVDRGIETVYVTTAVRLPERQHERLREALTKYTGKKITLVCSVDTKLLCGIKVRMQTSEINDSAQARLEKILEHIKS